MLEAEKPEFKCLVHGPRCLIFEATYLGVISLHALRGAQAHPYGAGSRFQSDGTNQRNAFWGTTDECPHAKSPFCAVTLPRILTAVPNNRRQGWWVLVKRQTHRGTKPSICEILHAIIAESWRRCLIFKDRITLDTWYLIACFMILSKGTAQKGLSARETDFFETLHKNCVDRCRRPGMTPKYAALKIRYRCRWISHLNSCFTDFEFWC